MSPVLFYQQQAARQQAAADIATLQNQRERCQRAADAWAALAARSGRADSARQQAAADKLMADTSENPDRGLAAVEHRGAHT